MLSRLMTVNAILLIIVGLNVNAQEKTEPKPAPKKIVAPYQSAPDKPLEPKEEVVTETDDHTQFRVEFNGIKGDRVPAYLYVPKKKDAKAPYPAILLQYGSGGNKNTNYIVEIGKQFVARGYVVLTIDVPGHGERKGKEKLNAGLLGQASSEIVLQYCGDYGRSVDYLAARADVNKDRLGYVGISWGAITGITYCAHDPRIKAVGSMVGGGNLLGLYSKKQIDKAALEGAKDWDPVCHVARIAPRPLLFINVTKDQLVPKYAAESLHKYAGEGSKIVWLETDHYFKGVDRKMVCESVIDFMDEKLVMKKPPEKK